MFAMVRTPASVMMLGLVFATCASAQQPRPEPKPQAPTKSELERLAGTWVFDEVTLGKTNQTRQVWSSILTVVGDSFTLSKFMEPTKDLKGTVVFDPANPKAIDLKIQEFDVADLGTLKKIPAGTLQAIFSLKDDRLMLCFPRTFVGKRPVSFESNNDVYKVTFVRMPVGFNELPKEIEVQLLGPDSKPAVGVTIAHVMYKDSVNPEKKDVKPVWEYYQPTKTGQDGSVKVKYDDCKLGNLIARDVENKRMAIISMSPAMLVRGKLKATLVPECHITGKIVCDELARVGRPVQGTVVRLRREGNVIAFCISPEEKFEFFVAPGSYTLEAYGSGIESKTAMIAVPPDWSEFTLDPIAIPARALTLLKGKTAPELVDVVSWKGKPVKLSELKGKYVLLEFWGYWCSSCIGSMPVLIELHEKYADKGLAIVGVHVDRDGEVDTVAKLDDKLAGYKKELWKGKDVPFPVALASGKYGENAKHGGLLAQYGIPNYPSCILIDCDGKVVDQFDTRDIKKASEEIEKLLEKK